jgi:hypothetical protein
LFVQAETTTTVINRSRDEVFTYLNEIRNITEWASDLAQELNVANGRHKVVTPEGELFLTYDSHPDLGLIDMWAGPTEDLMAPLAVRVLPLQDRYSVVTMTLTRPPDLDDAGYAKQLESLTWESANLKQLLER